MKNRAIHNDDVHNKRKERTALPLGSTFFNQASVRTNESMIKKKDMEVFQIKIYQFKYFYIMSYYCSILYSINHY